MASSILRAPAWPRDDEYTPLHVASAGSMLGISGRSDFGKGPERILAQ